MISIGKGISLSIIAIIVGLGVATFYLLSNFRGIISDLSRNKTNM